MSVKHSKHCGVYFGDTIILILCPSGRKCIYDTNTTKYLVQTRDEVEQGDEKMKELEVELEQMGLYDSDFSLGDVLDEPEDDSKPAAADPQKRRLPDFPQVEGDETVVEYIGQYKKACLTRKALLKTTKDRLERDKAKGFETLGLKCMSQECMCILQHMSPNFRLYQTHGSWESLLSSGKILKSWKKQPAPCCIYDSGMYTCTSICIYRIHVINAITVLSSLVIMHAL